MKKNIYNRPAGEEMQSPFGGAATKGGGERSEPVSRIVFMPYDTEK